MTAANVLRRHLTTDQKRTLAIKLIRERPNDSDRKIALLIGVSNKTVRMLRQPFRRLGVNGRRFDQCHPNTLPT